MRVSDAAAKKKHILDATCRLLVKHGFQDVVLDDVAHEAGVAKGTLFLYYKSKDDLLFSAFADMADQLAGSLAALAAGGKRGLPLLTETVETILGYLERKRDFLSQFGAGQFQACGCKSQKMLTAKLRENGGHLVSILKICARDGVVRNGDFSFDAFALMGLCRGIALRRIAANSREPLREEARKVLKFYLHGTAP